MSDSGAYTRRVLIAAGVGAGVVTAGLLAWQIAQVLLALFAASLFAILLDGLAGFAVRGTRLPRLAALILVLVVLLVVTGAFVWSVGPQVSNQISALAERVPAATEQVASLLRETAWGRAVLENLPAPEAMVLPSGESILARISGVFSTTLSFITNTVIIVVVGLYLALEPNLYVNGVLRLLPASRRQQGRHLLRQLGHALRWWLVGRIASMTAVGLLTAAGLWMIDLPLMLGLSVIAGLLSFVPYLGPILAAVPAILVGLVEGPWQAFYVIVVYSAVQFLEGNIITPVIQERVVSLPPAVLLAAQLAMGVLFGLFGVLVATPLAVAVILVVQVLYIQTYLAEPVRVLGDRRR